MCKTLKRLLVIYVYVIAYIFLASICAYAQQPEFKFNRIGANEGLSQVSIRCILQDSKNYMWFGTDYGLNKYDGYKVTIYKIDTRNQGSNIIVCLYEDSKRNLWAGTLNGLYRYDREHDKFIAYKNDAANPKSISANGIQTIYEDKDHHLWISTFDVLTNKGSLNLYDDNNGFIRNPEGLSGIGNQIVNCFYEEENGNLWLGLNTGLSHYDRVKKKLTFYNDVSIKNKMVNSIIKDNNDNLWIAKDAAGISILNKKTNTFKNYIYKPDDPSTLSSNQVFTLLLDRTDKIWAATGDGGLNLYNPKKDNFYHYTNDEKDPTSLSQDIVRTLYQDRSGIIWIGIFKSGINFILPLEQNIKHYKKDSRPGGLSANKVKAFCEDKDGTIWIGTDGGGLNKFNKEKNFFTTYKPTTNPGSIGSDALLDVFEDSYYNLWIATWDGGLNLLDRNTNTFKRYNHNDHDKNSISSNNVWCMLEDYSRNLWVATFSEGLNIFNREKNNFERIPCYIKNEKSRIMCMAIDHDGYIWIGTNSSGLGVLDPRTKKIIRQFQYDEKLPASLSSNGVYNIFIDSKNRIWIATDKGINLYNPTKNNFTTWQTTEGLPHDVVVGILEDGQGNLWISTLGGGLTKFNPETQIFSSFSMTDELHENKFLESSCMKTKNGEMYFGGIDGFNVFHPDSIKKNSFMPPVYFTDFQIFNKSVKPGENSPLTKQISETKEITLSYKQSVILFEFTALNYINSKKNQYAYKLEGFDAEWNYIGTKRSASYTNLNSGEYTLRVKASNDDGVWNENGAAIKLIIEPPFWKTWWAYTFYVASFAFALYIFREYSIIHIREKNRLIIERLENKKIAEVTEAKMRFFTNISHEIRTPLTLISGPLQTVITEEALTSSAKKNLSSVSKNVKRLLGLVNQLLQFRKLDLGFLHLNASETSIVTLIKDLLEYFEQHAALKNVDIVIDNQLAEEKNLWLDREMITTVFYNLLANAIKYTQPGGHINIRIFEGAMPKVSLVSKVNRLLSFHKKHNSIAVEVTDTGKGIPTKELKNIFRRFYQVEDSLNSTSGSGLGLSLVKEYIELHKGFIEVHSKVQHGTSFTIYFPKELKIEKRKIETSITYPDDHLEDWMGKELDYHGSADKRKDLPLVLIVEDDLELLDFLRESLLHAFRVEISNNGKSGLEKALGIFPDLIISDIAMPEMDGYSLCKEVKSNIAINHIPVILLTAKALEEDIVLGYNLGADVYMPKPFNVKVLEAQSKALIRSREMLREKYKLLMLTNPTSEIVIDSPDEKFLKQLIEITEANIEKPAFDVPSLATEMSMSHSALFRKVKSLTGLSIVEFIKTTRLKRAAMIFKKEKLTVSEVSYRVGFADLSYFSKCFTKEFGKTPTEYLKEYNP